MQRAWPGRWEQARIDGYADALHGADHRHIQATLDQLIRGGWTGQYAPVAPTLAALVKEVERQEARDRRQAADDAKHRAPHDVAPPWHALLWAACFTYLQGVPTENVRPDWRPYREIVDRHQLTPEDAGVRWVEDTPGGRRSLVTMAKHRLPKVDEAIAEAEALWRSTGDDQSAHTAAVNALIRPAGKPRHLNADRPRNAA